MQRIGGATPFPGPRAGINVPGLHSPQALSALPGRGSRALNPGAGAAVQAQLWYRDPLNTSNQPTSLSDAIEFCVSQ